jgi:pyrimidine operon attenuation protein/uracil phosphoribosyltransferase
MSHTHDIPGMLDAMAAQLRALIEQRHLHNPVMVGIHTGGVWIAAQLHRRLGLTDRPGMLDISFYRDDFTRIGINPVVHTSELKFSIDDRHIILVDDVLHTGRTIRAALNELFDYGRPASILLAVLIDRSGRELPIEANAVGQRIELAERDHIKLTGPDPLALEIKHGT